jgi:hypothetical protein
MNSHRPVGPCCSAGADELCGTHRPFRSRDLLRNLVLEFRKAVMSIAFLSVARAVACAHQTLPIDSAIQPFVICIAPRTKNGHQDGMQSAGGWPRFARSALLKLAERRRRAYFRAASPARRRNPGPSHCRPGIPEQHQRHYGQTRTARPTHRCSSAGPRCRACFKTDCRSAHR